MLTRATPPRERLAEGDLRRRVPRFDEANVSHNMRLVDSLASIARERNVTPAQLALAWVVDRSDDVVGRRRPVIGLVHRVVALCIDPDHL